MREIDGVTGSNVASPTFLKQQRNLKKTLNSACTIPARVNFRKQDFPRVLAKEYRYAPEIRQRVFKQASYAAADERPLPFLIGHII